MPTAIVLQLQEEALDSNRSVSNLLRKAFVVATKLDTKELREWLDRELNGYPEAGSVPEYRILRGQLKAWNPYHGWVPVQFEDNAIAESVSTIHSVQSAPELEDLLERSDKDSSLAVPVGNALTNQLNRNNLPTHYILFVSPAGVANILSAIRNAVLNWALKLEADGVVGEGLSFTSEERTVAQEQQYNVNNFYGPVSQANIQSPGAAQFSFSLEKVPQLLDAIETQIDGFELGADDRAEAEAEIGTVRAQMVSPRPKHSVIRASLGVLQRILESAAGSGAAYFAIELGKLLTK